MKSIPAPRIAVLALAALTAPAFAQTAPADAPTSSAVPTSAAPAGAGLLGKRYAEAGVVLFDYNHAEDDGYSVGTTVNMPVRPGFDVGATFEHSWAEGDQGENYQDLSAFGVAHIARGDFRPFARAELGHEWWYVSNDAFYQLDAGSEYLVDERLSVSAQVSWTEFLAEDWNGGNFSASTRANYWLTESLAASATLGYIEGGHWNYGVAAVFAF